MHNESDQQLHKADKVIDSLFRGTVAMHAPTIVAADEALPDPRAHCRTQETHHIKATHRDSVCIFLANALGLSLALLERVLVLELGAHLGAGVICWGGGSGLLLGHAGCVERSCGM